MRLVLIKTKVSPEYINPNQITRIMTMVNLYPEVKLDETKVMMSDGTHFFVEGTAQDFVESL